MFASRSLEAKMCVTNGIPLGSPTALTVSIINYVETPKAMHAWGSTLLQAASISTSNTFQNASHPNQKQHQNQPQQQPAAKLIDPSSTKLTYWTDNGTGVGLEKKKMFMLNLLKQCRDGVKKTRGGFAQTIALEERYWDQQCCDGCGGCCG
jgi:hypothetical protein